LTNRIVYADILRVCAISAVVFLHSATPPLYLFNTIDLGYWWTADIIDAATRWGVPIFIMISGMLLLDPSHDEPTSLFFKKRFNRVILPFLVWSVIYSLWSAAGHFFYHGEFNYSITGFLINFLEGKVFYHLGFFYYLIGLYLITPILRVYTKNASNGNLIYFLILWLVATVFYSIIYRFCNVSIAIQLQMATGFIGYYILGYFFNRIDIKVKWRRSSYILASLGLLITIFGTYVLTVNNNGQLDEYLYGYLTLNVIVIAAAIFIAGKYAKWPANLYSESAVPSRLLMKFSNASLGIFLIHPMILNVFTYIKLDYTLVHPLLGISLTAILTILISFVLVIIMQKIPVIKRIVP
jgi:surface polysaccharide O-acyltransferase-like enzyme